LWEAALDWEERGVDDTDRRSITNLLDRRLLFLEAELHEHLLRHVHDTPQSRLFHLKPGRSPQRAVHLVKVRQSLFGRIKFASRRIGTPRCEPSLRQSPGLPELDVHLIQRDQCGFGEGLRQFGRPCLDTEPNDVGTEIHADIKAPPQFANRVVLLLRLRLVCQIKYL